MAIDMDSKVREIAARAKEASIELACFSDDQRNAALSEMAEALRQNSQEIVKANEIDMSAAEEAGQTDAILDRLMLNEQRVHDMACALESLSGLPDPTHKVLEERDMYNGMLLRRVSVPFGVVAVIFEARPNVCADAAGICVKSGNACILRGGSLASHSNDAIIKVLSDASDRAGLPPSSIQNLDIDGREATDALMRMRGLVDLLVPRGGAGLIRHCVETSLVPIIETGTGNCHVYVHESADIDKAVEILANAKCRRYGVCNACESLLVDRGSADEFIPEALPRLLENGVTCHCDDASLEIAQRVCAASPAMDESLLVAATEGDWGTEYLGPQISIKCVSGVEEAVSHINRYGTHHSDAIVANSEEAQEYFSDRVDSAAVYVNASTAFTDGGQFGLGAEIGISTQKLHVRGPFALEALTCSKYVLRGDGHVRD